jgi:AraC-like DNA-binding protein
MNSSGKRDGFEEQKLFVLPEYMLAELSNSELTRDLYVSDIGYFPIARHHYRERMEGSDSHIFILCTDGEGWIELDGAPVMEITRNHLVFVPAHTPHRYGASKHSPWSIYWFHLYGDHVTALTRMYELDAGPVQLTIGAFSDFRDSFDRCYELLSDKPYSLPVQAHVSQSMRQLISGIGISSGGSAKNKKREGYLETAIRYMNERLEHSIKLPELAKYTGISKQHLILLFNEETGFPPIEYFLRLKIQKAAQLLSLTSLTIKEIAFSVGIPDPYYFSRLFKKMTGSSPSAYRSIPKG